MSLLYKRDPEERNVIVICLVFASVDVLKAIFKTFSEEYDMKSIILKQKYDNNPAVNVGMSLAAFDKFRERSEEMARFLIELSCPDSTLVNCNSEESYTRYLNLTDRLGRTSLHIACLHGLDLNIVSRMVLEGKADVSLEDIEGQTPLCYAVDQDRVELVQFFTKQFGFGKC